MKGKKILLVEDNVDHADLITSVLETEGFENEILLIRDGQEVMDYFQKKEIDGVQPQIDLILLDLKLPKVNGMAVLKFLKKYSKYSSIPVIILSAISDPKTISEAYENRANSFIIKSPSYEGFSKSIKTLKEFWLNINTIPIK